MTGVLSSGSREEEHASALHRVIGKPGFTDLFSSLGTVYDRLENKYFKLSAIRQLFHNVFPTY